MAERNLTFRDLTTLTKQVDRRGLSHSYLSEIATGTKKRISAVTIEILVDALEVDRRDVAEYRLYAARRQLDPEEVGLEEALKALAQVEAALEPPPAKTAPPARAPVPESLKRRAAGGTPSREDQPSDPASGGAGPARKSA